MYICIKGDAFAYPMISKRQLLSVVIIFFKKGGTLPPLRALSQVGKGTWLIIRRCVGSIPSVPTLYFFSRRFKIKVSAIRYYSNHCFCRWRSTKDCHLAVLAVNGDGLSISRSDFPLMLLGLRWLRTVAARNVLWNSPLGFGRAVYPNCSSIIEYSGPQGASKKKNTFFFEKNHFFIWFFKNLNVYL